MLILGVVKVLLLACRGAPPVDAAYQFTFMLGPGLADSTAVPTPQRVAGDVEKICGLLTDTLTTADGEGAIGVPPHFMTSLKSVLSVNVAVV